MQRASTALRAELRGVVWHPHTRLFLLSDGARWVLTEEVRAIGEIADAIGVRVIRGDDPRAAKRQSLFCTSIDQALNPVWRQRGMRVAAAIYHGTPGTGVEEFDRRHRALCENHSALDRLQVTNTRYRDVVLQTGIDPAKVHLIPLGVDLRIFRPCSVESRIEARRRYGLPHDAPVIGSFQKDGIGWEEGMTPKLIKGPDLFLRAIAEIKRQVPGLHVFLSGPARGYVVHGLRQQGVPHTHVLAESYVELGTMYHALDLYLVTSREEGGPKAVLESMASGVPLVSSRVGQAIDMVRSGENGWMFDVDDIDGMVAVASDILLRRIETGRLVREGLRTAERNSYAAQRPLWRRFFDGFVETKRS